jgi:DNA-binding transcriptional regulator YiaG
VTASDLKAWRERLGLKEVQAAAAMDVPAQSYRNWEDGRTAVPRAVATLARYIERFGVMS